MPNFSLVSFHVLEKIGFFTCTLLITGIKLTGTGILLPRYQACWQFPSPLRHFFLCTPWFRGQQSGTSQLAQPLWLVLSVIIQEGRGHVGRQCTYSSVNP